MDKAHDLQEAQVSGKTLRLLVDGKPFEFDLTKHSARLAEASQAQREHSQVSPSGYGIHWPDVDEDLSIDGLIGVRHPCPMAETPR